MTSLRSFGLACVVSLVCASAANASRTYIQLTDVGTALSARSGTVVPTAIDYAGRVVGYFTNSSNSRQHAFFFDGTTSTDLNTAITGGAVTTISKAMAIRDDKIVGIGPLNQVFIYTIGTSYASNGVPKPIGALAANAFDNGIVVGQSTSTGALVNNRAFQYNSVTGITTTPQNPSLVVSTIGGKSTATGINAVGDIVGYCTDTNNNGPQAFIKIHNATAGKFILSTGASGNMTTYPVSDPLWTSSQALAISPSGLVAGYFTTQLQPNTHAFIYQSGGAAVPVALGIDATTPSIARAVNVHGEVVGQYTVSGAKHGFLYDGYKVLDLNSLLSPTLAAEGWTITDAVGINAYGLVAALATNSANPTVSVAVRLTPVPLPGSGMLGMALLACVGGVGLVRRLRRAE